MSRVFQLQVELVQSLYESLTTILDGETVKNAKDILEWIGIISGGAMMVGGGLFGLYKKIFGQNRLDGTSIELTAEAGSVIYGVFPEMARRSWCLRKSISSFETSGC